MSTSSSFMQIGIGILIGGGIMAVIFLMLQRKRGADSAPQSSPGYQEQDPAAQRKKLPSFIIPLALAGFGLLAITLFLNRPSEEPQITETVLPVGEGSLFVKADEGGVITHSSGAQVKIPPGALGFDQTVSITNQPRHERREYNQVGVTSTGTPFDIQAEQDVFNVPIKVSLPYKESLLPEDYSEGDIFPVYYFAGEWRPLYGEVDENANMVHFETYHLTWWDLVFRVLTQTDLSNLTQAYRCIETLVDPVDVPDTLAQAQVLVDQRLMEWHRAFDEANFEIERLEDTRTMAIAIEVKTHLPLIAAEMVAKGLGGETALLKIGGHPVVQWAGMGISMLSLGEVSFSSGEVISAMSKLEYAHQNLMLAYYFRYLQRYPDAKTIPHQYIQGIIGLCGIQEEDAGPIEMEATSLEGQELIARIEAGELPGPTPGGEADFVLPADFYMVNEGTGSGTDGVPCELSSTRRVKNVIAIRYAEVDSSTNWRCPGEDWAINSFVTIVDLVTGKSISTTCKNCGSTSYAGPDAGPAAKTLNILGQTLDVYVNEESSIEPDENGWSYRWDIRNYHDLATGILVFEEWTVVALYEGQETEHSGSGSRTLIDTNIPLGR